MKHSKNWPAAYLWSYTAARMMMGAALKVLSPRFCVSGRGSVPRKGAVILAPNHLSDIDPPLVGYAMTRPLCYMAKKELFDIPLLGPMITFAQAFPVERQSMDRDALRYALEQLKNERSLVVFPEGQCSPDGTLGPLFAGVAMLALKSKVPVIPVAIRNSNKIMPYGKVIPRFTWKKVSVDFVKPLEIDDLYDMPSRQARELFNQRLRKALLKYKE